MLLKNDALVKHPYLRRMPKTPEEWTKFIQTLNAQDVVSIGAVVLSEYIRLGQTAYDNGTGFWLGSDSGTPKLSIGNSSGNKLIWNGTTLSVTGALNFTNSVQTFTPAWTGFSSDPSGDLSYLNLGAIVFLWNKTGSDMSGTSDSVLMTIDNLPSAIRPANDVLLSCNVIDAAGAGGTHPGSVAVTTGGTLIFRQYLNATSTALDPSDFTNSGTKGLPEGWLISYAI